MATVPGVLLIGDYSVQGGNPGLNATINPATLQTTLAALQDRTVMRIVPDVPATLEPSGAFRPWYDHNAGDVIHVVNSSTTTTITVSPSPGWTTNEWATRFVTVISPSPFAGAGFWRRMQVSSNTADTLTFPATPTAAPAGALFFLGLGRMKDYHPAAGWLRPGELIGGNPSTRGGSSAQANGNGVGPDATLVRALAQGVYSAPPYFYCAKWGHVRPTSQQWGDAPNDTARPFLVDELARMDAAAAADGGNTIQWEVAVIDQSIIELEAWSLNPTLALVYQTRLREMIAWLRSPAGLDNPNLLIVLVNHRSDLMTTTAPNGARWIRAQHLAIARDTAGVGIVDMEGARPGDSDDTGAAEIVVYAQQEYFALGLAIERKIQQLKLGIPDVVSGGLPVYLMVGDSIAVGEIPQSWTENANSVSLSGPNVGNLLRPANQLIWNRGTGDAEVYNPHTNSNTSGSVNGAAFAGPELSIMAELGARHPGGFLLIKRASYSSTLAADVTPYNAGTGNGGRWIKGVGGEHYDELLQDFRAAVQYVNELLDRQVDLRGAFVLLGHNDQTTAGGSNLFEAELAQFCQDLRDDFGTRTSGDEFPIVWRLPMLDVAGANPVEMANLRRALQDYAASQKRFRLVDVDGLEVDRDDGLHETPATAVETGRRMVAAMVAMDETSLCNATPIVPPSSPAPQAPSTTPEGLTEDDTVASYSTPELSVTRRSVDDLIKLERHRNSRGMPRRTRVRFDR